jgi:hypothetical protein
MTQPSPVTVTDIAALLQDIRNLSDTPNADPATRAAILARKAELLARIAVKVPRVDGDLESGPEGLGGGHRYGYEEVSRGAA